MKYLLFTTANTAEAVDELSVSDTLGFVEGAETIQAYFSPDTNLDSLVARFHGSVDVVVEEDWSERWKEKIRPIHVGPITIVPPWLAEEGAIIIEPDMAFGTGDHPTTRACLAFLVRHVKEGSSVLDFGCGSGILSIAAARLGASRILSIDHDPKAVEIARKNAIINDVAIMALESEEVPVEKFDIVVANIQSSVLLPRFDRLNVAGSVLILSGLLVEEKLTFENVSARIIDGIWETFEIGA